MNKSIGTAAQSATRARAEDSGPWARNPAKIMVGAWLWHLGFHVLDLSVLFLVHTKPSFQIPSVLPSPPRGWHPSFFDLVLIPAPSGHPQVVSIKKPECRWGPAKDREPGN